MTLAPALSTLDVQRVLYAAGYLPGPPEGSPRSPVDGVPGRITAAATAEFQRKSGRPPTGMVDLDTAAALISTGRAVRAPLPMRLSPYPPTPWVDAAKSLGGTRETPGKGNTPAIMGWAKRMGGWVASWYPASGGDATPWCGLFVGHCIGSTLPLEPLPKNPLGALNWSTWGVALDGPTYGAVATFTRTGGGHVGFLVGEDPDAWHVIGGNQDNAVNVTRMARDRLDAFRWPSTVARPLEARRVRLAASARLSVNEA